MLLTVKKQVEETLEVNTPCYYKTFSGHSFINDNGQLITIRESIIFLWNPDQGKFYTDDVADLLRKGEPCTKEEFEKAYADALAKFNAVIGLVETNS